MGFVVDVRSTSFSMSKEKFRKALAALKALAKSRPNELEDAAATLAAKDLVAALAANYWNLTLDGEGNATALELSADKLPQGASELAHESVLGALSRHVDHGRVCFVSEGDPGSETSYTLGKALQSRRRPRARYTFSQDPERPRVAPGDSLEKTVTLVHRWGEDAAIAPRIRNPEYGVRGEIDARPIAPGDQRALRVEVGPDALDVAWTILDACEGERIVSSTLITVTVEPKEHVPLEVASVTPQFQRSRKLLLSAKDVPRALADVHAWAAKTKDAPGGAFLAKVASARTFTDAMRAAGVVVESDGDVVKSVRPIVGTLPCSEWHLLRLLQSFSARTLRDSGGGFEMVRAGRPNARIEYSYSMDLSRRVLRAV